MPDYPNIPGLNQHESAYAVGPIIWEPVACANDESRRFLSQRQAPLVYISMGSTGSLQLFQSLVQALEKVPEIDAFITTGGQFPEWFDSLPPRENVHIANIYPGSEVLTCPRCIAAVNHGGSGSVYQALEAGCTSLMLPSHAEQQWNAVLVSRMKLGIYLNERSRTPALIARALRSLVSS